jgi:predicted ATPase
MAGSGRLCPLCSTDQVPLVSIDELPDEVADGSDGVPAVDTAFELSARYTGRAAALGQLGAAVDEACQSDRLAFALLIGEPGMGKTSTLAELSRTMAQSRPTVRFLFGPADRTGALYAPFTHLLTARFELGASDGADESREKILATVAEVMPPARVAETAHLIAHLLRVPFPDSPVLATLAESPHQLEARTFLALRRFLAADAALAPLVLCFENIESFEPESVNLLHYLVAGLGESPIAVIGTARPSLDDEHPSFADLDPTPVRIELGPLVKAEAESLLRELCRALDSIPPRMVEHARALGGSPRALYELVRYLLESDLSRAGRAAGAWTSPRWPPRRCPPGTTSWSPSACASCRPPTA